MIQTNTIFNAPKNNHLSEIFVYDPWSQSDQRTIYLNWTAKCSKSRDMLVLDHWWLGVERSVDCMLMFPGLVSPPDWDPMAGGQQWGVQVLTTNPPTSSIASPTSRDSVGSEIDWAWTPLTRGGTLKWGSAKLETGRLNSLDRPYWRV